MFKLIQYFLVLSLLTAFFINFGNCEPAKRRKSTTPVPILVEEDEDTSITGRENNLLKREEVFKNRELKFNERELNFTARENQLREREILLSKREKNVEEREKNSGNLKCGVELTTPKPDLYEVRYDKMTEKWYDIGSKEPCGENMRFFAVPEEGSNEGVCDCDYHQCSRPLIYSQDYNQCFYAWSQGPCESNEWYTFNETLHPICEQNTCLTLAPTSTKVSSYYFRDPEDGECYENGSKGYCEGGNERLLNSHEDPFHKCKTRLSCTPHSVPPLQICLPGNRRTHQGLC